MKYALYVRVSTETQNPEMQINELKEYCDSRGWKVFQIFVDRLSGKNTNRPEFQEMNRLARLRRFQGILVYRLDRAFRSLADTVNQIQEYNNHGIKFTSLHDHGMDTTTPSGTLMLHLVSSFAQFEASIIQMRVKSGIANARSKGIKLGRPRKIDLQKVIQLKERGLRLSEIAKELGVNKSTISRVLQNPILNSKKNENGNA
ncbi:MAG: recombinase family protein [Bdellovibrio sp.]|nr:recombinase family protein [Bdellovibrio sp.]